jgi:hypothetical protein
MGPYLDLVVCNLGPSLPESIVPGDAILAHGSLGAVGPRVAELGCPVTPACHPPLLVGGMCKTAQSRHVCELRLQTSCYRRQWPWSVRTSYIQSELVKENKKFT